VVVLSFKNKVLGLETYFTSTQWASNFSIPVENLWLQLEHRTKTNHVNNSESSF